MNVALTDLCPYLLREETLPLHSLPNFSLPDPSSLATINVRAAAIRLLFLDK